jgi:hypothetical protein
VKARPGAADLVAGVDLQDSLADLLDLASDRKVGLSAAESVNKKTVECFTLFSGRRLTEIAAATHRWIVKICK